MKKHRLIKLSLKEKHGMTNEIKKDKKSLKYLVVLCLDEGIESKQIARILGIDPNTVTKIKKDYDDENDNWTDDNNKGSKSKLTQEEKEIISKFVEKEIITDAKVIQKFVLESFNVEYCLSNIHTILKELGFVYDYPKASLKGDSKKQRLWEEEFKKLKESLTEDHIILFSDAVHPTHNTEFTKMWIKKDNPKALPTNSGRQRVNIQGSYNVENCEAVLTEHETINSQSIIEHYEKLKKKYPKKSKIYIIQDNAAYYHSTIVKKWLKEECNHVIIPKFIPPYSPNLNKIERFWLYMKREIMYNHHYPKFKDFKKAIDDFRDSLPNHKDKLKTFITLKFDIKD
jgi:transposase